MGAPVYRVLEQHAIGQDGRKVWQVVRRSGGSGYEVVNEAIERETAERFAAELNTKLDDINQRLVLS